MVCLLRQKFKKLRFQMIDDNDDLALTHDGFKLLRLDQAMDLGFYTADHLAMWVKKHEEYEETHGPIYGKRIKGEVKS